MSKNIIEAIRIAYPEAIQEHKGEPFKRPEWTGDDNIYLSGFYWLNTDGDRFYYNTFDEAAMDLAFEIDMDEDEARRVIRAGRAVT